MWEQPLTPELAAAMTGLPVCLVLEDGSERIGRIAEVRGSRIILSRESGYPWDAGMYGSGDSPERRQQSVRTAGRNGKKAGEREESVRFSDIRLVIPLFL